MRHCGLIGVITAIGLTLSRVDAGVDDVDPASIGLDPARLAAIDEVVAAALAEKKLPGCVVLIGRPQGVAWCKAYGQRQLEPSTLPMTTDTVFDLASLTKPLATATAVMTLIEQQRLEIDDPVCRTLPEFGVSGKESITIRDLLLHRSGLIPDNPLADYFDGPERARERLMALKPIAEPRTRFMYSDVNFLILGAVIEKVSAESLRDYTQQRIFAPLGMSETMYLPNEALRARAAPTERRGEDWIRGEVHDPRAHRLGGVAGHAGLFGTARDLARYAVDALAGLKADQSRILKRDTWTQMTTRHTIAGTNTRGEPTEDVRGLGWDMQSRYSSNRGTRFSSHAFGHGGFTGTALWIDPDNEIYVVFLSNRVHPNGKGSVNPLAGRIGELAVEALIR